MRLAASGSCERSAFADDAADRRSGGTPVPMIGTMLRIGATHVVAALALIVPAGAAAQERARPDPDSPAGVEYQLPLDRAREEASGPGPGAKDAPRSPGEGAESGASPLFGEGISPAGGEQPDSGSADDGTRGGGPDGDRADSGVGAGSGADEAQPALAQTSAEASGSGGATIALIALGVLLVGGLAGLGLRRGMRTGRRA